MSADPLDVLDLDADRASRAAQREGRGEPLPIRFGGEYIATLPTELPLDVLTPLREIDDDLALMLRAIMQAAQSQQTAQSRMEATNLVIDLLVSNPALPTTLLDTAARVGRNLLSDEGYDRFMGQRPSREDIAALAKGVFKFYGVSLGEASAPSDSQGADGETSNTTSKPTSESTPEESTPGQEPLAS